MMSLTFGLFTQVSGSGPLGPLVSLSIVGIYNNQGIMLWKFPRRGHLCMLDTLSVFLIKTYVVTPLKNQRNKMVLLRDLSIDFC